MATKFKTGDGREWVLQLSLTMARDVKTATGVDLLAPDNKGLMALAEPLKMYDVAEFMVRDQIEALQIEDAEGGTRQYTETDFGLAWRDGDVFDNFADAIRDELINFTRSRYRPAMTLMMEKQDAIEAKALEVQMAKITGPDAEARMVKAVTTRLDKEFDATIASMTTPTKSEDGSE